MKTRDFFFELPPELIAQEPNHDRESARIMVLDRATGRIAEALVSDLPTLVEPGTVMVLNDTKVRKARLFGETESGSKVEVLLLAERQPGVWEALAGNSRRLKPGKRLRFPGGLSGSSAGTEDGLCLIRFDTPIDDAYLEEHGHVPLPPYIKRKDTARDCQDYQTVYARETGSAAAPTAGLHFTPALLHRLAMCGCEIAYVTLHVGLGTFLPMRTESVEDHPMHEELYSVPLRTKGMVERATAEGRPVLAVGTTVVRTLESAWGPDGLKEGDGRTRLFIYPGFPFKVVTRLLTNFHTPCSSLLVLVSAFAGKEHVLSAYREAIDRKFRFFSYGDAMLIR